MVKVTFLPFFTFGKRKKEMIVLLTIKKCTSKVLYTLQLFAGQHKWAEQATNVKSCVHTARLWDHNTPEINKNQYDLKCAI